MADVAHVPTSSRCGQSGNNHITYAKTWAEDVQNYRAAKSVLPWLPEQQVPVKHVTRYEKSHEEREYDIVLGRFREENQEVGLQQLEASKLKRDLEKGRAKQLRNIQRFHTINNEPMYPGAKDPKERVPELHPNRRKSAADYNIVTHVPIAGAGSNDAAPVGSTLPSRRPYREFNILTNKYHDRHDDRFDQEATQAKRLAAQKYFKTRTFDPVRITYVDEDREKEFLIRRHEDQQVHGKDRVLTLPPREQFSEGRLYNILNQQVINPEKLVTMNEKGQRALNKMQKTAFEKKMRVEGDVIQARETDLCLNRYAHERHIESHLHGYDVVSNQTYAGRDAKFIPSTRTHAPHTAWKTIESGLLVNNKVAPKAPSTAMVVSPTRPPSSEATNILVVQHPPTAAPVTVRTGGFQADVDTIKKKTIC